MHAPPVFITLICDKVACMFRVMVLSLCLGCTGLAQQIPSCRVEVPAAVFGSGSLALASSYSPRDLKIRLDGRETTCDFSVNRAERLVVLVDHRESMAEYWSTLAHTLPEVVAAVNEEENLSLVILDEKVTRIDNSKEAIDIASTLSTPQVQGKRSIYDVISDMSTTLEPGDAIVVLTSGMDTPIGPEEIAGLRSALVQRGVRLNSILFLRQGEQAIDVLLGPYELKWLALATGGSALAMKPSQQTPDATFLPSDFMDNVMKYSVLQLQLPEGGAPERLAVTWRHPAKQSPPFVVPETVGPCPLAVSASFMTTPTSATREGVDSK
jgi:hypothetical protein